MKEYIIRMHDLEHDAELIEKFKDICREFGGEYYTKVIDKNYKPGKIKLIPPTKGSKLYWERKQI